LILIVLGLCAYFNAIFHPFVHDDIIFIQNNAQIANLDLKSIIFHVYSPDYQGVGVNVYYRPLLELVTRIQYQVFQLNPFGFHFFNILLHIANSFLVFLLMAMVTQSQKGLSLGVAVLFLLHPVQTEAVACVSGISNLLYSFLCLLSFYAYLLSKQKDHSREGVLFYAFSIILFFVSLFAKVQAVILPILIILYEVFIPDQKKRNRSLKISGYFVVLAGYFAVRKIILGAAFTPLMDSSLEFRLRLLSIPKTLLVYLKLIVFPEGLHYYRSIDILQPFFVPSLLLFIVVAVVISIVRRQSAPQRPLLLFGLGWFCIALAPVLNIIPLINEYSFILTSEHFLYLPLAGMSLFLLKAGQGWFEKRQSKAGFNLVIVIMCVFMFLTVKQNRYWRSEVALFERVIRYENKMGRAHILLAQAYYFDKQYESAIKEYKNALVIMQGYMKKVKERGAQKFYLGFIKGIHFDLGHSYLSLNNVQASTLEFHRALDLDPNDGVLHNSLGANYIHLKNFEKAVYHFKKAILFDPSNVMAMNNLAICYLTLGKRQEAESLFREILKKDPAFVAVQMNLKRLLLQKEEEKEATD